MDALSVGALTLLVWQLQASSHMLQRLPSAVGRALRRVRPGVDRFICRSSVVGSALPAIELTSPAFGDQQPIPVRYTADGDGISPPLAWGDVPEGTRSIALLVEDADSPTPAPLVHAIAWHIDPALRQLAEGGLAPGDHPFSLGVNSLLRQGWLPPDPPPGHGLHRHGFQVFALDHDPELGVTPGRSTLIRALRGHTLAHGLLIGTYER
jgi:Raf kinase inhibitor-like YbhB/YbcL family protein